MWANATKGLDNGFIGFDLANKTCNIFDSSDEPFSGTNVAFIGKCVAASLKKPEETANSFLTVASFTTTQNDVLRVIEEETGSKFAVTKVKTSDLEKISDEKVAKKIPPLSRNFFSSTFSRTALAKL